MQFPSNLVSKHHLNYLSARLMMSQYALFQNIIQNQSPLLQMNGSTPCLFYMQGRCRFGSKCYYSHQGFLEALMIRHAESQFNKITNLYPNENFTGEQSKARMHFNKQLIDCCLSKEGVQQALKVSLPGYYIGPKKEIDIVFVSPLRRTLETAQIIIKANKLVVKHLIVVPQLTQVLSKICDFSSSLEEKRKKFKEFDFSEMNRFLKESEYVKGQHEWQDIFVDEEHEADIGRQEKYAERYFQILENIFPTPLQNSERCFNRSLKAIEIMKQIAEKLKAKKILIVSHNRILKYFAGRFSKGRATSFQNCEIRQLIF